MTGQGAEAWKGTLNPEFHGGQQSEGRCRSGGLMPPAAGGAPATSSPLNEEFAMCNVQGLQMQG